jgi:hypothetical protein
VPVLKWRQGEYQALLRLREEQKTDVVPLLEITPPDYDFELGVPKHTIDAHLAEFAKRLEAKWGSRLALLDTGLLDPAERMVNGAHPLLWLLDEARPRGGRLVPVTSFERDSAYQEAVRIAHQAEGRGAALRCSLEDAADGELDDRIETLLHQTDLELDTLDILIDLRSPNFNPIDALAQLMVAVLTGSPIFQEARSVTIIATAFPTSMAEVAVPIAYVVRSEWDLYTRIIALLPPGYRRPAFGDYAIAAPDLFQGDMRLIKPSATVRYATERGWLIAKGPNVRDNGFGQYRERCRSVVESAAYLGGAFSTGSDYIDKCRAGISSTGNLTTWRWVGTNHHIAKVLHDLAIVHGP